MKQPGLSVAVMIIAKIIWACSAPEEKGSPATIQKADACCAMKSDSGAVSDTSSITCPKCGYTKTEVLPTDVCVIQYDCKKCGTGLNPKKGDCCVYCSYGSHKCPSKQ